jgi:phage terminase Nu1 subunit (DNA packaging protein)
MAKNGKGQVVKKGDLCELFGVSIPTVDGWLREGCPCISRGGRGVASEFNTAAVTQWLREKARQEGAGTTLADESELKRRKLAAEAEKVELDLAKAKGEVAPVREFERATASIMAAIRTNMRNVPGRAVLQLLGCTDETEFKSKLMAEIDLALVTAADAEVELDEEDDEGGTDD